MRIFFTYLQELGKQAFFLILFLLGIGSTASTYIPSLENRAVLKWFGWVCIFIGLIGANFRLYRKYAGRENHRTIRDIIDELEANMEMLQDIKYSTTPALRDEAWNVAADKNLDIPDALRSQVNSIYNKIRSAKAIHQIIQSAPIEADTRPEQMEIEKIFEDAK